MTRHSAFAALALTSLLVAAACGGTPPSSPATAESRREDTSIRSAEDVATLPALTPEITELMARIRAADKGQLAVSEEDGRFLRLLVVLTKSKKAIEIGGASGYSAIWLGLGMRETGGKLTTIEYDPVRAQELKANIAAAGLNDVVTVVAGDAFRPCQPSPGRSISCSSTPGSRTIRSTST